MIVNNVCIYNLDKIKNIFYRTENPISIYNSDKNVQSILGFTLGYSPDDLDLV